MRGKAGGDFVAVRRYPGAVGIGRQDDAFRHGQSGLRRTGKTKAFAANTGDVQGFGSSEGEEHEVSL